MIDGYVRVNRNMPCPICGHTHWCLVSVDGTVVLCPRIPSEIDRGALGYMHRLENPIEVIGTPINLRQVKNLDIDWDSFVLRYPRTKTSPWQQIPADWLARVWAVREGPLGWLMSLYDDGRIVGAQWRYPDGSKQQVKYSGEGVFLPAVDELICFDGRTIYVCEGFSDSVFLSYLQGVCVVGKLCATANKVAARYIKGMMPKYVIIVADADNIGIAGAKRLGEMIQPIRSKIVKPVGGKDIRQMYEQTNRIQFEVIG